MGLRVIALAAAILAAGAVAPSRAAVDEARPRLAVILMVDQMRADYVNRFMADWTQGLKRLVTSGAWFRRAAYPYLTTVTCAGHATVGTGAFPHTHGVIQNAWWDRERSASRPSGSPLALRTASGRNTSPARRTPRRTTSGTAWQWRAATPGTCSRCRPSRM